MSVDPHNPRSVPPARQIVSTRDTATDADAYVLRRIKDDPRLAYYFGYTEALERLTRAHALATGIDPTAFHREFQAGLRTEAPRCRSGECHKDG